VGNDHKTGHEPLGRFDVLIRALQQPLDVTTLADDKTAVASLNQRRPAKEQPVIGTGEAKVPRQPRSTATFGRSSRVSRIAVRLNHIGYTIVNI
jgi:hypothetical protein